MNKETIFVEVVGGIDERGGTFKNDKGEDVNYHIRSQDARLESGGFVYPFEVRLENGQVPYPPGRYRLCIERMLTCNKKKLSLSAFPKLEAVAANAKAA